MPPARINAGSALAALGAVALLIGLFLDWYEPGVTAWTVFELVDLLLALLAVAALLIVAAAAARVGRPVGASWMLSVSIAALILVVEPMINNPPAVIGAGLEGGAWVSFGGAVAMVVGAVLSTNRISVEVSLAPRTRARAGARGIDEEDEHDDPEGEAETRRFPVSPD